MKNLEGFIRMRALIWKGIKRDPKRLARHAIFPPLWKLSNNRITFQCPPCREWQFSSSTKDLSKCISQCHYTRKCFFLTMFFYRRKWQIKVGQKMESLHILTLFIFSTLLSRSYQDRLTRCVLYKPSLKLRALLLMSRPFLVWVTSVLTYGRTWINLSFFSTRIFHIICWVKSLMIILLNKGQTAVKCSMHRNL